MHGAVYWSSTAYTAMKYSGTADGWTCSSERDSTSDITTLGIGWTHCTDVPCQLLFPSLVPRPPRPAFVACSTKSGGRPGQIYHVMRAAADVMFSLLTSGFVLSPSLFFP